MAAHAHTTIPPWTWIFPLAGAAFLAAKAVGLVGAETVAGVAAAALLLGACVFASVHHAELLAVKLGEPYGAVLLAVAITVIEVGLIASIMFSGAPGAETVARDTVFSAAMIVLNGVVGLCLVLGGRRHFEQSFRGEGASAALAVVALILPNFTRATDGPSFAPVQLAAVGIASLALWAVFVFVQTVRHRDYFLDADADDAPIAAHAAPSDAVAIAALGALLVALVAVVLLAKALSAPMERAIDAAGLPPTFLGVVIATIVLLPEGLAAVRSALANRLQNSVNLALGSAVASIGLTVPVVALLAIPAGVTPILGVSAANMVLLGLTLFASTLTLATGRTTVLQGAVHLVIFAVFLLLAAVP
ncbi:MAG: calcium:proton antiporter [Tagaea sp.]